MNIVCLIGRLGGDPELRYTQDGKGVARFDLAVDRYNSDDPDWFSVTSFGRTAENVAEHMAKGCKVGVTGRLQQDKWEDKNTGEKRSRVIVIANQIDFLTWPEGTQGG